MLDIARDMVGESAQEVRRLTLPDDPLPQADAIVAVGHPLSYLPDAQAIDRALIAMAAALRPGGLLAFDICDLEWGRGRPDAKRPRRRDASGRSFPAESLAGETGPRDPHCLSWPLWAPRRDHLPGRTPGQVHVRLADPGCPPPARLGLWAIPAPRVQAARRRTSQTVAVISSTASPSSQPPSIHWNGQNRLPGWYLVHSR
jgi:hypothetical protein